LDFIGDNFQLRQLPFRRDIFVISRISTLLK